MDNFFNTQRILSLIWERKFHFVLIGVIAIVLSAIFSGPFFITPKYKSTARIYPTNTWVFSDESETEQMLEVLNSNDLKFRMFDAFELDKVYKINKEDVHYYTYMLDIYNTNVSTSKTEFETAEIKVLDEDPNRAAAMCDSIITFYNQKVGAMHKAKDKEMVEITGKQLEKKNKELKTYQNQLDSLRNQFGIISYGNQVSEITRGYMNALATGRSTSADTKKIQELYSSFTKEGTQAVRLENLFNTTIEAIDSLNRLHETHLIEFEKNITYSHVVEYPFVADKKSYPVRWLIVAFSTLSAVFLSLLVFLVLDYKKH
jgi:uncharacterized protein involved in exopolysaccharide biosynthesis